MNYGKKKLTRSVADRKFLGVCGGLANYFNIDPVVIRVVYAIFAVCSAFLPALLLYIICGFIIPEEGR